MTQNADQCHLLKSINLQCCQSFEKFCVLTELFLFWAPTPTLQLWLGDSSGSCRLGTQNAQHMIREHRWKTLLTPGHVRILQELQRKNPAGQNCTTNSFFLWFLIWWQEWWRLVTKHFWMKYSNSLWPQVFVEMYPFETVINQPIGNCSFPAGSALAWQWHTEAPWHCCDPSLAASAGGVRTGLPGSQQDLPKTEPPLLSPCHTWSFWKARCVQEPLVTLRNKLWLSYISKTIVISSPVGSFAISVFQNFLLNKLFVPSFANAVNKWGRGVTTLVLSGLT